MPIVTLSSKHQVTLPAEMVRTLGLKPGDKLVVELIGGHIVLLPRPASWADYFAGSLKGVFGSTREEIDRYIAEVRYGGDIDALKDALALDPELRAVYDATSPTEAYPLSEIKKRSKVEHADQKLQKLEEIHAVKRLEQPAPGAEPCYRRVA